MTKCKIASSLISDRKRGRGFDKSQTAKSSDEFELVDCIAELSEFVPHRLAGTTPSHVSMLLLVWQLRCQWEFDAQVVRAFLPGSILWNELALLEKLGGSGVRVNLRITDAMLP